MNETKPLTHSEERWLMVFERMEELKRCYEVSAKDVTEVVEAFKANCGSQSLCRTLVRNFAAHVEGFVYMMKQVTLALSTVSRAKFGKKDLACLAEAKSYSDENGEEQKLGFPEFHENFRFAFKSYASVNGFAFELDHKDKRYKDFREVIKLRHRLMHPKSLEGFHVSDQEVLQVPQARAWFEEQASRLLATPTSPSQFQTKFMQVQPSE